MLIIIFITLLVLYFLFRYIYKFDNFERHLYDNNDYAHFSKITKNNFWTYPKYYFSSPQKFILNPGDALVIPKKWWHWVTSYENTFGINYWWNDNELFEKPQIIHNFIEPVDILKTDVINQKFDNIILDGVSNKLKNFNQLKNYLDKNQDESYLLTLQAFVENSSFKNQFEKFIKHPEFVQKNNINKNYNLWYCIKNVDTGLHYDDNYGLLCVLSGQKIVYLYPPSDSKYLYPFDLMPKWVNHSYEDFEFNIYKSNSVINNVIPSSRILYETMRKSNNFNFNKDIKKSVVQIVDKLIDVFGSNKIIWGAKCDKNNGNVWWEYYFYNIDKYRKTNAFKNNFPNLFNKLELINWLDYLKSYDKNILNKYKNATITSLEVHNKSDFKSSIDFYINLNDKIDLPFYGKTMNYDGKNIIDKNYFIVCTIDYFYQNIDYLMNYFKFSNIKDLFLNEIKKYNYVDIISFYRKNENYICIQWFGLSMDDFINFLKNNNWSENFINYYESNKNKLNHIRREITINYKILKESDNYKLIVDRTSIYGLV